MRKFEQVKDIETIKEMAIAGWPIKSDSYIIEYCNDKIITYSDSFDLWEEMDELDFTILPPEITLEEARERIKSGVVYCTWGDCVKFEQVFYFTNIEVHHSGFSLYSTKISNATTKFYPFDPTPFSDLLEEVEEEPKKLKINLTKGDYEYIATELNKVVDYVNDQTVRIDKLTARIEALEGKK